MKTAYSNLERYASKTASHVSYLPDVFIFNTCPTDNVIMKINNRFKQNELNWHAVLTGCRCDASAAGEGVTLVSGPALAHRVVFNHGTVRVGGTGARARVAALLVNTGKVAGTFTMDKTLWPAVGRRTDVAG